MSKKVIIAIDAMGGENSPAKVIEAINIYSNKNNQTFFHLFGKSEQIKKEIGSKSNIIKKTEIINCSESIEDSESPLNAAKRGKETSMWKTIESQKNKQTHISLSAGNTGALLVISRLILKTIDGISKPALAGIWPNKNNMSVVLDLGANIECSTKNLVDFSVMGSALHKSLFEDEKPKVALLNIGSEELKGNAMIKETYQYLIQNKFSLFDFNGYIEGNNIMEGNVNVIVADGFTGNIALKTAEGTSNFIISELKKALTSSIIGKISSLINFNNLNKFKNKLDPRLYNGAILLGLNKPVIKSHGSTDSVGFANSLKVCEKTIKGKLIDQIKDNLS